MQDANPSTLRPLGLRGTKLRRKRRRVEYENPGQGSRTRLQHWATHHWVGSDVPKEENMLKTH